VIAQVGVGNICADSRTPSISLAALGFSLAKFHHSLIHFDNAFNHILPTSVFQTHFNQSIASCLSGSHTALYILPIQLINSSIHKLVVLPNCCNTFSHIVCSHLLVAQALSNDSFTK